MPQPNHMLQNGKDKLLAFARFLRVRGDGSKFRKGRFDIVLQLLDRCDRLEQLPQKIILRKKLGGHPHGLPRIDAVNHLPCRLSSPLHHIGVVQNAQYVGM